MRKHFTIALVGRPNVGKSRLFNALTHSRRSIVHDKPGVTRDVIAMDLPNGVTLLDTGGLGLSEGETPTELVAAVENQVEFALALADVIVFVLDGKIGLLPLDLEIALRLRKTGKRVVVAVNKIDHNKREFIVDEAFALGFSEKPLAVSAEHGLGIDELEATLYRDVTPIEECKTLQEKPLTFAFFGAPNVGKSSLSNALLGEQRMIVSDIAGTTRDTIHGDFIFTDKDAQEHTLRLLDTAGLRAQGKMSSSIEFFSSVRTRHALEDTDVAFLVLDAARGLTKFDKKIAAEAAEAGKCLAVVVNKWDLTRRAFLEDALPNYRDEKDFRQQFEKVLRRELFAWPEIPIVFLSAETGEGMGKISSLALELWEKSEKKITTGILNRFFIDCFEERPPSKSGAKIFKIFYAVQVSTHPLVVRIYCNAKRLLNATDEARLRRKFIAQFNLGGCAINFHFVSKEVKKRKN